jgi:hypothetical protein
MRRVLVLLMLMLAYGLAMGQGVRDRFVWIFGWGLTRDEDVPQIIAVLEEAARHGYNGAVLSANLDALCKQPPEYFRRLKQVKDACDRLKLELIPSVFSVGYGGGVLWHDSNLAEGMPVKDALFVVRGNEARHVPDPPVSVANGGFEEYEGYHMRAFAFHDEPGTVSFPDTQVAHSGKASLRFENFRAQPAGNARVMQEVRVRPYRCYRMSVWVKTEGLQPSANLRMLVLAGDRDLAPRTFSVPATSDWRKLTMIFNSLANEKVLVYVGVWGGQSGKFWVDDWTLEEVGPVNVLRRPGTPVTVKSEDGSITYQEGKDYAPLTDPNFSAWRAVEHDAPALKLLPGSRIRDGQRLRVSWYHPMLIYDSQVTVCMAEPALYEIFEHEAKLLWEHLRFQKVILSMDEVRMGGTCAACAGKDMAKLLGECVTRQVQILRKVNPKVQVYIWSDMFDPNHNAHANYYLVQGDFTGSWKHMPKDLIIAVWGGAPRAESLRFFEKEGFRTLIACYYDAPHLEEVKGWQQLAQKTKGVTGFMYTTWERKYDLIGEFAKLLWGK